LTAKVNAFEPRAPTLGRAGPHPEAREETIKMLKMFTTIALVGVTFPAFAMDEGKAITAVKYAVSGCTVKQTAQLRHDNVVVECTDGRIYMAVDNNGGVSVARYNPATGTVSHP
jgi:hypothetical protein